MLKRQELASNRILQGSNIDPLKHRPKLAEISVFKGMKKRSLLDEILKKGQRGKSIFVMFFILCILLFDRA